LYKFLLKIVFASLTQIFVFFLSLFTFLLMRCIPQLCRQHETLRGFN